MKIKYIFSIVIIAILSSCTPAGTLEKVDKGNSSEIEVYRYYFEDGEFVYVSRFKDSPKVSTTTWKKSQGKTTVIRSNVVIFENDSIKVLLQNK